MRTWLASKLRCIADWIDLPAVDPTDHGKFTVLHFPSRFGSPEVHSSRVAALARAREWDRRGFEARVVDESTGLHTVI